MKKKKVFNAKLTKAQKGQLVEAVDGLVDVFCRRYRKAPHQLPVTWMTWGTVFRTEMARKHPGLWNLIKDDRQIQWHAARFLDIAVSERLNDD